MGFVMVAFLRHSSYILSASLCGENALLLTTVMTHPGTLMLVLESIEGRCVQNDP